MKKDMPFNLDEYYNMLDTKLRPTPIQAGTSLIERLMQVASPTIGMTNNQINNYAMQPWKPPTVDYFAEGNKMASAFEAGEIPEFSEDYLSKYADTVLNTRGPK